LGLWKPLSKWGRDGVPNGVGKIIIWGKIKGVKFPPKGGGEIFSPLIGGIILSVW